VKAAIKRQQRHGVAHRHGGIAPSAARIASASRRHEKKIMKK
jgi:hypothetical protein